MKYQEFKPIADGLLKNCADMLVDKGGRYNAINSDFLDSFKRDAEICKLLKLNMDIPAHRALYEIIKKTSRLISLSNCKRDVGADVRDSVIDIINFAVLYYALDIDAQIEKEKL
jgi:hypothetical protein